MEMEHFAGKNKVPTGRKLLDPSELERLVVVERSASYHLMNNVNS
ncbi:hypothetical protein [Paenibacillus arenosi]|nr:hypothetical protein [Paenibacillus arenosi]